MIPRYSTPAMERIWSDANRFQQQWQVEFAVIHARHETYAVPEAVCQRLASVSIDPARVRQLEKETQHETEALVRAACESFDAASRYVHIGLTSSDVTDTALAMQLAHAGAVLLTDLSQLHAVVYNGAKEHAGQRIMGRTHGQHAVPMSFGLKWASWAEELRRAAARLAVEVAGVSVGTLSGPVGTYTHIEPEIEAAALRFLGLGTEPVPTQVVARDRHAAFITAIALCGGTLERIATEIRNLARPELGEVGEPFAPGQVGSSAMPHKQNPITSEKISGLARLLRGYAQAAMEDMALWHERDLTHSSVERVILPDACAVLDHMLLSLADVLSRLSVNSWRMGFNVDITGGEWASGALLLLLLEQGWARDIAQGTIQQLLAGAGGSFEARARRTLADITPEQFDEAFDEGRMYRHVDSIIARLDAKVPV